ncbi:MAG: hypothetical protein ABI604_15385, partial [Nitrospirota bacterium]
MWLIAGFQIKPVAGTAGSVQGTVSSLTQRIAGVVGPAMQVRWRLGVDTSIARRTCPRILWQVVRRKLDQINRVRDLSELAVPRGNRL